MKKIWKRKIASLLLLGIMCLSLNVVAAQDYPNAISKSVDGGVTPYFTYIYMASNNLELNSGGRFTCEGDTGVYDGYDAALTMELQQYTSNGWETIQSWYDSDSDYVSLSKDWYVLKGYSYRLKNTHQALSYGSVVETYVSYSDVKNYF